MDSAHETRAHLLESQIERAAPPQVVRSRSNVWRGGSTTYTAYGLEYYNDDERRG